MEINENPNTKYPKYGDKNSPSNVTVDGINYLEVPSSIILWMKAYNLIKLKVNIPNYSKPDIHSMSEEELKKLSDKLTLKDGFPSRVIEILGYLHKINSNSNCSLFDEAVYDAGHKKCWFYIRIKDIVVEFGLHMDEDVCWDFFKFIDCDNLHPHPRSSSKFNYGSKTTKEINKGEEIKIEMENYPEEFKWLNDFLAKYVDSMSRNIHKKYNIKFEGFEHFGVKFYNL